MVFVSWMLMSNEQDISCANIPTILTELQRYKILLAHWSTGLMKISMTRMRRTKPCESCWKETVKKLAAFSADNKLRVINYRVPIVCSDKETELRLGEPKEPTRDR